MAQTVDSTAIDQIKSLVLGQQVNERLNSTTLSRL